MGLFRKYKTIEELLPGFLLEKEISVGYKVYQSYNSNALVLLDWLDIIDKRSVPIREVSQNNIKDFFYYLAIDKGLDKPTCEKYFLHLRSLFIYAYNLGEIDEIPFDYVVFPRKKKDQGADVIHNTHLKPLLEKLKEKDPQLFLAAVMEYYCFIRPGRELRFLKIGDIDCENGIITIRQENAKNKLRQVVTMPSHLIEICKEYNIDTADKSLFVFSPKKKFGVKPISVNMFRYRFNKIRAEMNLPTTYKFYSFKHTGASNLHKSGLSMRELMDQLRHTKLEATSHYLKHHCGIVNDRIRDNFPNPLTN